MKIKRKSLEENCLNEKSQLNGSNKLAWNDFKCYCFIRASVGYTIVWGFWVIKRFILKFFKQKVKVRLQRLQKFSIEFSNAIEFSSFLKLFANQKRTKIEFKIE